MEETLCSEYTPQSTDSWQEATQNKRYDSQSASNRDSTLRECYRLVEMTFYRKSKRQVPESGQSSVFGEAGRKKNDNLGDSFYLELEIGDRRFFNESDTRLRRSPNGRRPPPSPRALFGSSRVFLYLSFDI